MMSRAEKIILTLSREYGTESWNWHTRRNPFQVLIGTVLSQRTADSRTDKAARNLFSRFPTPEKLSKAPLKEIENLVRPSNFYKTKAIRVKEISKILVERFSGKTPDNMEELLTLPGVGRKTANAVILYGFGRPALVVDVHVHRISNRLGLIRTKTPEESESKLWKAVPEKHITHYNELLVKHGQTICRPITPLCYKCPVIGLCHYEPKTQRRGGKK